MTKEQKAMIITPAILTTDPAELERHLRRYIDFGFRIIDIDVQEKPFATKETLCFVDSLRIVEQIAIPEGVSLGWDLKMAAPRAAIRQILESKNTGVRASRIIYYAQADIAGLREEIPHTVHLGLGILGTETIKTLALYEPYPEVQLMTIRVDHQGAPLDEECLGKAAQLRSLGYRGQISIDGGVNAASAPLIAKAPLDRVCVGSYFQKAQELRGPLDALQRGLAG